MLSRVFIYLIIKIYIYDVYFIIKMLRDFPRGLHPVREARKQARATNRRANRIFLANFNGLFTRAGRVQIGPDACLRTPSGTPRDETPPGKLRTDPAWDTERYVNGVVLISVICH